MILMYADGRVMLRKSTTKTKAMFVRIEKATKRLASLSKRTKPNACMSVAEWRIEQNTSMNWFIFNGVKGLQYNQRDKCTNTRIPTGRSWFCAACSSSNCTLKLGNLN